MGVKYIGRWLFGRKVGSLLQVNQQTEWGLRDRDPVGMSLTGVTRPGGFEVRTGKVEGKWQIERKMIDGDHLDVWVSERGIKEFCEGLALVEDAHTIAAAKLLGLLDMAELRKQIKAALLNPKTHVGGAEQSESMMELEQWVRADAVQRHPDINNEHSLGEEA